MKGLLFARAQRPLSTHALAVAVGAADFNAGSVARVLLHEFVERADPDAPALIVGDETFTFGALADRVARVSAAVAARTAPGDRVAFVGENSRQWIECYYGVPRAGRILTFLNHRLAPAELRRIVERSGATLTIGEDDLGEWDEIVSSTAPAPAAATDEAAVAWLIYTSGTTGSPKGAMLTHRSLRAAVEVTAACRPVAPDDVYLFPFPLCHVAGYNVLNHHYHGRPVVLLRRFEPAAFVEATARHGATTTSVAATMLSSLLDHVDATPDALDRLRSMRSIAYGAAPMPATLLRRGTDLLGVDFLQGYGMTELSGNAVFLGPDDHRRGLTTTPSLLAAAGRPGPGVDVRVVDDEMHDAPVGEIVIRAEQVTAGYWDDEAATADAFRGGWFHTGDVGRWGDEGELYVVDRKKDVIVTGGENVSSREVEDVLHHHPGVRDVAVVGVPDPHWGENVCAVVVRRDGTEVGAGELVDVVRGELAGFKRPRHVVFVDELPRNASGKVLKHELRRWLSEHPEQLGDRA